MFMLTAIQWRNKSGKRRIRLDLCLIKMCLRNHWVCGRMQSFLESYILDLMKKFFENAANDFRCRWIRRLESCRQDIRCGFSLHLHFLMMRNFLFWMSLHQDWTHYFEKNWWDICRKLWKMEREAYLCPRISQKIWIASEIIYCWWKMDGLYGTYK